jgi:hypothetical protein
MRKEKKADEVLEGSKVITFAFLIFRDIPLSLYNTVMQTL